MTATIEHHNKCDHCHRTCRPLRCSRCRQVLYCSVACQKAHWKESHRLQCGAAACKQRIHVEAAWTELQNTLKGMSPEQAYGQFQKGTNEMNLLKQMESEKLRLQALAASRERHLKVISTQNQNATEARAPDLDQSLLVSKELKVNRLAIRGDSERKWTYVVEEMLNISCYQVTVRTSENNCHFDLSKPILSLQPTPYGTTIVCLSLNELLRGEHILLAQFPGRLVSSTGIDGSTHAQVHEVDSGFCVRLQSQDDLGSDRLDGSVLSTLEVINSLQCRFCEHALLGSNRAISKVMALPTGFWDEITDYLICYNGEPMIDFASSSLSALPGVALEDASVVVLHRTNVGEAACVLAVEGYGENDEGRGSIRGDAVQDSVTFRGLRDWRDSVGGATLCCSQCCSALGHASLESPDTFRFLKHRLSVSQGNDRERNSFDVHSCATFIANEMVRYAESKAIFTFLVAIHREEKSGPMATNGKCLLLKILNWNTRLALSDDSRCNQEGVDVLRFRKFVKVIFEVATDQSAKTDHDNPISWPWGGVDLCCLPELPTLRTNTVASSDDGNPSQSSSSSVRLYISTDEWTELKRALIHGSGYFSKDVTNATMLVKLGTRYDGNSSNAGLSVLPLC